MNSVALKDRLKVVASEKGITFNEVWKQMLLERFLARLSKSDHHNKFIFKGGLLLAQYLTIGRETTDADFLMTKIKNETSVIETTIKSIFTGEISLLVYPVETIFAEKLETILSKGDVNSRMKDYHDIILMLREPNLMDLKTLKQSVTATFESRGTALRVPIQFDEAGMSALQQLWTRHLVGLGKFKEQLKLPEKIQEVVAEINRWLAKNLSALSSR